MPSTIVRRRAPFAAKSASVTRSARGSATSKCATEALGLGRGAAKDSTLGRSSPTAVTRLQFTAARQRSVRPGMKSSTALSAIVSVAAGWQKPGTCRSTLKLWVLPAPIVMLPLGGGLILVIHPCWSVMVTAYVPSALPRFWTLTETEVLVLSFASVGAGQTAS